MFHSCRPTKTKPVHDLPQLYQKPDATSLLHALDLLSVHATNFTDTPELSHVDPAGVPRYLTAVISSSLDWINDEDAREHIWSAASMRLSERAGRNALPSMTRSFALNGEIVVRLYEPSLTGDNLGLKTWSSSLLLAKRLPTLYSQISKRCTNVLELGAGTGLVGIAAACLWQLNVTLTDLPEIVSNLERNLQTNTELIQKYAGTVQARSLDWADTTDVPQSQDDKYLTILAADPIYSPEHPKLLVDTVQRWLRWDSDARFIVELPLRKHYDQERQDLRHHLAAAQLALVEEGTETGYDDWQDQSGNPAEVECWWSIWKPSNQEEDVFLQRS